MASPSGESRIDRRERCWERNQEIIHLYTEHGLSPEQIAAHFDLRPGTVSGILSSHGVLRRARQLRLILRVHEMARLYTEAGLSLEELAARFSRSRNTVAAMLRMASVSVRRRDSRPPQHVRERNQEMVRLYVEEGLTPRQVSARVGLSSRRVSAILREAGVSLRRASSGPPEHLRHRNEQIVRLYLEGLTLREVGIRFDLSRERVRQIARRAGVDWRLRLSRAKVAAEDLEERNEEITRLYLSGVKLDEIGGRFGLSKGAVWHIAARAGVPRRRPGIGGRRRGIPLGSLEDRRKRNEDIVGLYVREALTCKEVGARFGLSRGGVEYVLDTAGVTRRSPGWRSSWPWKNAQERTRDIVHAYVDERLSTDKVAARFGLNRITVRRVLEKAGVQRRRSSQR